MAIRLFLHFSLFRQRKVAKDPTVLAALPLRTVHAQQTRPKENLWNSVGQQGCTAQEPYPRIVFTFPPPMQTVPLAVSAHARTSLQLLRWKLLLFDKNRVVLSKAKNPLNTRRFFVAVAPQNDIFITAGKFAFPPMLRQVLHNMWYML